MDKKLIKLVLFNLGISFANIIVFSEAFWGIKLSGANTFSTAFGIMIIVMSIVVFFYGNLTMFFKQKKVPNFSMKERNIKTLDECIIAITDYTDIHTKTFPESFNMVLSQINRMKKKISTLKEALSERFSDSEISYSKFLSAISSTENLMILNITSLLSRLNVFDEDEYDKVMNSKNQIEDRFIQSKQSIYREYASSVEKAVTNNEEILLRMDKLVLEISKLSDLHNVEIDQLDAIKEIDTLIKDTRWYK